MNDKLNDLIEAALTTANIKLTPKDIAKATNAIAELLGRELFKPDIVKVKISAEEGYIPSKKRGKDSMVYLVKAKIPPITKIGIRNDDWMIHIEPNDTITIQTGITIDIPKGYRFLIVPNQTLYRAKGVTLSNAPLIIDSNYDDDEIVLHLTNTTKDRVFIHDKDVVAEMELGKIHNVEFIKKI